MALPVWQSRTGVQGQSRGLIPSMQSRKAGPPLPLQALSDFPGLTLQRWWHCLGVGISPVPTLGSAGCNEDAVSTAGCSHPARGTGAALAQPCQGCTGTLIGECRAPVPGVPRGTGGPEGTHSTHRQPQGHALAQRLRLDFIFIPHLPAPFVEMT